MEEELTLVQEEFEKLRGCDMLSLKQESLIATRQVEKMKEEHLRRAQEHERDSMALKIAEEKLAARDKQIATLEEQLKYVSAHGGRVSTQPSCVLQDGTRDENCTGSSSITADGSLCSTDGAVEEAVIGCSYSTRRRSNSSWRWWQAPSSTKQRVKIFHFLVGFIL